LEIHKGKCLFPDFFFPCVGPAWKGEGKRERGEKLEETKKTHRDTPYSFGKSYEKIQNGRNHHWVGRLRSSPLSQKLPVSPSRRPTARTSRRGGKHRQKMESRKGEKLNSPSVAKTRRNVIEEKQKKRGVGKDPVSGKYFSDSPIPFIKKVKLVDAKGATERVTRSKWRQSCEIRLRKKSAKSYHPYFSLVRPRGRGRRKKLEGEKMEGGGRKKRATQCEKGADISRGSRGR